MGGSPATLLSPSCLLSIAPHRTKHRDEAFVYVAPMKALVQEMVTEDDQETILDVDQVMER